MDFTRRQMMIVGGGAALAGVIGLPASAAVDALISDLTGGATLGEGGVSIGAPEIAENGNTVPIDVSAPGAKSITVFADGNPTPPVAKFAFGPLSPNQAAGTRIRLAQTQNVIAVAEMGDGTWQMASVEVKVTIGGCGG